MPEDPHEPDAARSIGHAFVDSLPIPACLVDRQGTVVASNPPWEEALGLAGQPDAGEPHGALRDQLRRAVGEDAPVNLEVTIPGDDGQSRSFTGRCGPIEVSGVPRARSLCTLVEITEIRRREAQLAFMATHDVLTGLPNRRMFEDSLVRALARARRGGPGALVMLDIDHLKSYNDTLGHARGDQALVNFALLIQTHVRAGDMLARVGGDEFGVVLEDSNLEEAAEIAERMRLAAMEEAFVADARAFELGLSAGVVPFDGSEEALALVDAADAALYEAKNSGRNRVVVRAVGAPGTIEGDSRLVTRVRESLAAGRVLLHYQPVVRLSDGSTAYYESLVRLVDESGDVLRPVSFLSTVERLGLMPRLTRHVFDSVVEALTRVEHVRISLNLCGSDLLDRALPGYMESALSGHSIDPGRLSFEISEHVAASHRDAATEWLAHFGGIGCPMVLDRFSTGARGLALVQDLSFSEVKIDVSTLSRLTEDGGGVEYLEAVRRVVEAHGLTAVASRIEDPRVLELVRDAGFSYVQGYDIGEPRPTPE